MFVKYSHYLSYGSTDQATMRELWSGFHGLLVPGTVAAFQAEGTRGFVLSLSASAAVPYVVDPRFPLFQNQLRAPKKSHRLLAAILGAPELISEDRAPVPSDFTDELVRTVATHWVDFNLDFEDVQMKTFDKYAKRLGEEVMVANKKSPEFILAPYTMVDEDFGWWDVSRRLFDEVYASASLRGQAHLVRRVVASARATALAPLVTSVPDDELLVWVSDLDEFRMSSELELIEYALAIRAGRDAGKRVFALYGGFFAVLLARHGLVGASHGIGFGEHRDWIELPSSGAPPARYYVPQLHRYVSVDIATALWRQFPELIECGCVECDGRPPGSLNYHELMKHSVRVRATEIEEWLELPTDKVLEQLTAEFRSFSDAVAAFRAPAAVVRRAEGLYQHLAMWCRVLSAARP